MVYRWGNDTCASGQDEKLLAHESLPWDVCTRSQESPCQEPISDAELFPERFLILPENVEYSR